MNITEYKARLNRHDWYYYFSDDHRVYTRGSLEESQLMHIARTMGDDYKKALNEVHKAVFDKPTFAGEYKPPFNV